MLYNVVKYPQDSTTLFKELLMKCIWKIVKDFQKWDNGICYDLVLAQIHRFLEVILFIIFKNILCQYICDILYFY